MTFGEPVAADAASDRKAMTRQLEGAVRAMMAAALNGRPPGARRGRRIVLKRCKINDIVSGDKPCAAG